MVGRVTREVERREHQPVGFKPMAEERVPDVVHVVLNEDAERFGFGFANQVGIFVAAAHRDIGSDDAEYSAEKVGTLPCRRERADRAAAAARNQAVVGVFRQPDRPAVGRRATLGVGQQFPLDEVGEPLVDTVEFVASVEAHGIALFVIHGARSHENTDDDRQFPVGDHPVEDRRSVVMDAVHVQIETCGFVAPVCCRNVNPVVAFGPRIDFRAGEPAPDNFAGGRGMRFRRGGCFGHVRRAGVHGLRRRGRRERQKKGYGEQSSHGRLFSGYDKERTNGRNPD